MNTEIQSSLAVSVDVIVDFVAQLPDLVVVPVSVGLAVFLMLVVVEWVVGFWKRFPDLGDED